MKDLNKKRDREIKLDYQRYKFYIQGIPDIVYEIDSNGRFIFVSQAIEQLGYSCEELRGEHFEKIVHPDDVEAVSRFIVLSHYKGKKTGDTNSPKLFDERRTGRRMS